MPSPYSAIARDRLQPGVARTNRIFGPTRNQYIHNGTFRPSNRWRRSTERAHHSSSVLQRPLMLANRLPWLPKYNHARS